MKNISETLLQEKCQHHLQEHGFVVAVEVPFLNKMIDLLCYDPESGACIAIELKVHDWKRGIRQALTYKLGADAAYLAMPMEHVHRVNLDELRKFDIGLLSVSPEGIREHVRPNRSQRRLPTLTKRLIATSFGSIAGHTPLLVD